MWGWECGLLSYDGRFAIHVILSEMERMSQSPKPPCCLQRIVHPAFYCMLSLCCAWLWQYTSVWTPLVELHFPAFLVRLRRRQATFRLSKKIDETPVLSSLSSILYLYGCITTIVCSLMRRATKGYKMPVKQGKTKFLIWFLSSELF